MEDKLNCFPAAVKPKEIGGLIIFSYNKSNK